MLKAVLAPFRGSPRPTLTDKDGARVPAEQAPGLPAAPGASFACSTPSPPVLNPPRPHLSDGTAPVNRPKLLSLPAYATHPVLYAGALACEAAVYVCCLVGTALMLPAALIGVSVGGPLRYAKARWETLQGLRTLAGQQARVEPDRWQAFEAMPAAEQRQVAREISRAQSLFDGADDALRCLAPVAPQVRDSFCHMVRNVCRAIPSMTPAECLAIACALPADELLSVARWGVHAPSSALAWLFESHGPVLAGKVAWVIESGEAFLDLSEYSRQHPQWDMAIDTLLQTQVPPPVATIRARRDPWGSYAARFADQPWLSDAMCYAFNASAQRHASFVQLRDIPILMHEILDLPTESRDILVPRLAQLLSLEPDRNGRYNPGGLFALLRSELENLPRSYRALLCRAAVNDLLARPNISGFEFQQWKTVPLRSEAALDNALALRAAGMSVESVRSHALAYGRLAPDTRAGVLEHFSALIQHQTWSESEAFMFAQQSLPETTFARFTQQPVPLATAAMLTELSDVAWQTARESPDDLADAAWVRWLGAQNNTTLTQLNDASAAHRANLRVELTYGRHDIRNFPRALAVSLEARAPSLRWLQQMIGAIRVAPSRLCPALEQMSAYSAQRQLQLLKFMATNQDANLHHVLLAMQLLPELSTPQQVAVLRTYEAFSKSITCWNTEQVRDIERLLEVFGPAFSGWLQADKISLLQAFTRPNYQESSNYNGYSFGMGGYYGSYDPHAHESLTERIRRVSAHPEAVLQAVDWCREPEQEARVVDAECPWDRESQADARIETLSKSRPVDVQDPLLTQAATKRGAHALARSLAAGGEVPEYEAYFLLRDGTQAHKLAANNLFPSVAQAMSAATRAWGGHGPLPACLRQYILAEFSVPADERPSERDEGNTLKLTDAQGVHNLMAACAALHLPQPLDLALRVAALDVLDPPRKTRVVRHVGCASYGCETPENEAHVVLPGCACGQTLCNGCAKDALAAAPDVQTCRSAPQCGAPLTREYLERLDVSEADALARRAKHYREKLNRLPDFDFDQQNEQTLHGTVRPQPVYAASEIPPLPNRVDPVAMRMLLRGLARSPNRNGILVERECYHCGHPVQKDENCLHMAPQPKHMHGHWDFVRGPHGGDVRYARHGLDPQEYIPLVPGPLGRAHFYDGLPVGVMGQQTRARVNARRTAWLRQLDRR